MGCYLVNFQVASPDQVLLFLVGSGNVLEYVGEGPWYDPRVFRTSLHGVRLARPSLTVSKDGTIESMQH